MRYTEKQLVEFGNFVLGSKGEVYHADVENFKIKYMNKEKFTAKDAVKLIVAIITLSIGIYLIFN